MKMTLKEQVLAITTRQESISGQSYKYVRLEEVLAAIDSQPQPVAQGEAVAWQITDAKIGYWGTARNERIARDLVEQMTEAGYEPLLTPLYATPTTPTDHRVVPVEPQGCDPRAKISYRYGYQHGWTACREAMLAASPAAGGV